MIKAKGRYVTPLLFKQSSELEILISAAIVFAAFKVMDIVPGVISTILNNNIGNSSPILVIAILLLLFVSQLLPISIATHFIFRFYWLSLVGLRTAFKRQKTENLSYAERYMNRIRAEGNLDRHIDLVDKICSSIFAFSFLTVFVFCFTIISITLFAGILIALITYFDGNFISTILEILVNIFVILCIITMFDFFTLGSLKKIKRNWFVKIYYPITRFMGFVTLSYFYRGLYYTFITNIPKKLAAIALPLYLLLAILLLNAGFYESKLFATETEVHAIEELGVQPHFYKESFTENSIIQFPFIDNYIQSNSYLTIYIPLTEQIEDSLIKNCEDIVALNNRGMHWRKWIKMGFNSRKLPEGFSYKDNALKIISCFKEGIHLSIRGTEFYDINWKFYSLTNPEKIVMMAVLDIVPIPSGENSISITMDGPIPVDKFVIPFYKVAQ